MQAMVDEARAADSVPHEIVREWLLALARGERVSPPLSRITGMQAIPLLVPEDADDEIETEQLRAAVERSRAAERRGEVIPHERVRDWLLALAQGERPPAPRP